MTAKESTTQGQAVAADGTGPDATTASAVEHVVDGDAPDTQAETRTPDAAALRRAQLAHLAAGTASEDVLVVDGTPVYPGPLDGPLPEAKALDESGDVDAGGRTRAQVLFSTYRVVLKDGTRVSARRGQIMRVTANELRRGVALGGLRAVE